MRSVVLLMSMVLGPLAHADRSTSGGELKRDDGWRLVQANCSGCHSLKLVTSNRGDRRVWLNIIRWMQKNHNLWELDSTSEESILSYLEINYSATQPLRRKPLERTLLPSSGAN